MTKILRKFENDWGLGFEIIEEQISREIKEKEKNKDSYRYNR